MAYDYNVLNHGLREIERIKIIPKKEEKKENVKIMDDTIRALVAAMMNVDPLFQSLFKRFAFTGSYYEGTRIGSASEFDVNLVFKLPINPQDVLITMAPNEPEYVRYKVLSQCKYNFFRDDYLCQQSFQRWMQSVLDKAIARQFQKPSSVRELNRSASGPSFIWYIKTYSGKQIDLDFVPVIDGTDLQFPSEIHLPLRYNQLRSEARSFFLVPKPTKRDDYWRFSFAEAEKHLISSDMGCLKLIIKLFKLLRDKNNWRKISSYMIRNFFLLQMEEHPSAYYWRDTELGNVFMEMLQKFNSAVRQKSLPYYFNRNADLFDSLDDETVRVVTSRLSTIIQRISAHNIYDFFM